MNSPGATEWALWSLPLGVILDLILGDPRNWPHPVRAIGFLIHRVEIGIRWSLTRFQAGPRATRLAGMVLALIVVGLTGLLVWGLVWAGDRMGGVVSFLTRAILIYFGLATRSLGFETRLVSDATDLATARRELSMIVGRDTANLDWPEVYRACVETVGENANDGVIAVLFWHAVGGPVGLWMYKAISTLDSMVGYRDARYRDLGWASARLDDLANLIPARLTWLLIAISAVFLGERPLAALRIGWRDGRKHPSPNSAWGEAAMAGALGIQLGGVSTYGGVSSSKPLLGDSGATLEKSTVRRSIRLMTLAALLAALLAWGFRRTVLGAT